MWYVCLAIEDDTKEDVPHRQPIYMGKALIDDDLCHDWYIYWYPIKNGGFPYVKRPEGMFIGF